MPNENDFDHHAAQVALMNAVDAGDDVSEEVDTTPVGEDVGDANDIATEIADAPDPVEAAAPEGVVADPYEQYGGEDTVKNAMIVANALKTEAGIRQLTARGLQTLGYDPASIEAFLAQQAAEATYAGAPAQPAAEDPYAGREDDDLLTVAEARELEAKIQARIEEAARQAQQPFLEQQQEAQMAAIQYSTDQALIRTLGDPTAADPLSTVSPEAADVVLRVANSLVPEGEVVSPQAAAAYVEQAHALVVAQFQAQQQARIEQKRAVKSALPTKTGGQGAGADAPQQPQNLKEADQAFFGLLGLEAPPR